MSPWPAVPMWNNKFQKGLAGIKTMLNELGSPQNKLPPVIHIAGTNGKGSSLAMLKSIYEQAGYRVSAYSSPHILNFNERIYLAGSFISDEYIYNLIKRCKPVADKLDYDLGFFQGTTIMAFLAFSETPADLLILETGMGGRLDCTNVVADPIATMITTIDFDHTEYLGDTIEKIATEKAGIMKSSCPCIIGPQQDKAYDTLFSIAQQKNVPTIAYEYDYGINFIDKEHFRFMSKEHQLDFPRPSLPGDHQILNAGAVLATIFSANNHLPVNIDSIKKGLISTYWPGRLEKITHERKKHLLPSNIDLYLDGAHNNAGATALGNWISTQDKPTILIIGMTKNRDPNNFINSMQCDILEGLTVTVESEPSSIESSKLAKQISSTKTNFQHKYTIEDALSYVRDKYNSSSINYNVVVAGSLFLIADCYKILNDIM